MVRIDPDKVTPLKGEAQSGDYLSKPARKRGCSALIPAALANLAEAGDFVRGIFHMRDSPSGALQAS
jgi:hypothetical protein